MKAHHLSDLAKSNSFTADQRVDQFLMDLHVGSLAKFNSLMNKAEEIAKQGFGSVEIKLDRTSDLFFVCERKETFYSEQEVIQLLSNEGFELQEHEDSYDAQSYILIWNKDLPRSNEKIGMSI